MAYQEVYRRRARKHNGEDYFELLLVYVDDVLCCLQNYHLTMDAMVLMFDIKDGSVVPPNIYLGAETNKYQVMSGKYHWSMPITQYVKNQIKTVEGLFKYE